MKNNEISNSIVYNVYPTSFFDSNGDGIGDIKGIIQKLPYIKQFADIMWVNPIFKSPFRDGGYDIEDYFSIDERFGTMEDVKEMISEAKKIGLKVLFDLVVGHTSDKHPWFLKSKQPEINEYSDYYIWNSDVFMGCPGYPIVGGNCDRNGVYLINFFYHQPALNYGFAKRKFPWQNLYTDEPCIKLHEEVKKIMRFYLNMGVDGFRVDLANSIVKDDDGGICSCKVWSSIFDDIRKEYPGAIFLSEWGEPKYAVKNGDFDIDFLTHCWSDGYNKLFRKEKGSNIILSDGDSFFRLKGKGSAEEFFTFYLDNLEEIKEKGYISIPTGNHDLPRISWGRTDEEIALVFAFILSLPCIPLIYYGDEIGLPYQELVNKDGGYRRTGSRTPMQWNDTVNAGFSEAKGEIYLPISKDYKKRNVSKMKEDSNSLINKVKKLIDIKRNEKCLRTDASIAVLSKDYPLIIQRSINGRIFICMINPSDRDYNVKDMKGEIVFGQNFETNNDSVLLKKASFVWMKKDN